MRNRILGAIGVLFGAGLVVALLMGGDSGGDAAAGQALGMAVGGLMFAAGLYHLITGGSLGRKKRRRKR
jgi:peptidoglycan/LPS O-acetylase OafA/YrhL